MAERQSIWDRIERWASRRRGEGDQPMAQPLIEETPEATARLERAEEQSAHALERANEAIEAVHDLEHWLRGRDRRIRNQGHRPERRHPRPPASGLAHAVITTRSSGRRLAQGGARR